MFDIHHHLLFGLDDGPPDLATSVAMARLAVADGITHVVCTPHASGAYPFQPELIAERLATLRAALDEQHIALTLGSGCDFHLSYDNIRDAIETPARFAINGGPYLLIELPDFGFPPNLAQVFYDLQLAGFTLILTHPERNSSLQRETTPLESSRLAEWLRSGVLVQVTADALMGKMGKSSERLALKLLDQQWITFLATDAHNIMSRPPQMSAARDFVARRCNAGYAELLTTLNPRAVFEGRPLPEQPAPRGLFTDPYDGPDEDAARPWWKRMLGR